MDNDQNSVESRDSSHHSEPQNSIIRQLLDRQDEVLQQLDQLDARVVEAIQRFVKSRVGDATESQKAA